MVISKGSLSADILWPGLKAVYGGIVDSWAEEYSKLFDITTSDKSHEVYLGVSGLPLFSKKAEAKAVEFADIVNGYKTTVVNSTYALGVKITEEMLEDEQYNVASDIFEDMANSKIETVEQLAGDFIDGFTTTSYYYDGGSTPVASASHTLPGGGSFSNIPSVASDFCEAALIQAGIDVATFRIGRADRKRLVKIQELFITPTDEVACWKILNSIQEAEQSNNAANFFKNKYKATVMHWTTDTDAWFAKTNIKGLVCQKRVWSKDVKRENEFLTGSLQAKDRFRLAFACYNPASIYYNEGA